MENGYTIFFLDESIFQVAPYIAYGWFAKGSRPTILYQHKRREKHIVLGALNSETFFYEINSKLNSKVFKKFVLKLINHFKKIIIVIDNAPFHFSKEMQAFYSEHQTCLHVINLPSYSPELNPIEQSWRETKKWLSMRRWVTVDELKEEIITAFQQPFVMTPI